MIRPKTGIGYAELDKRKRKILRCAISPRIELRKCQCLKQWPAVEAMGNTEEKAMIGRRGGARVSWDVFVRRETVSGPLMAPRAYPNAVTDSRNPKTPFIIFIFAHGH